MSYPSSMLRTGDYEPWVHCAKQLGTMVEWLGQFANLHSYNSTISPTYMLLMQKTYNNVLFGDIAKSSHFQHRTKRWQHR